MLKTLKKSKKIISAVLALVITFSLTPQIFVEALDNFVLSWALNGESVTGYVYDGLDDFGFVIDSESWGQRAFVTPKKITIPYDNKYFSAYSEYGHIVYRESDNYEKTGLMDTNGNVIIPIGKYSGIIMLNEYRFLVETENNGNYECGIVNQSGEVKVPFGKYYEYDNFSSNVVLKVWNDKGEGIIDYNGNVIVEPGKHETVYPLSRADRYLGIDGDKTVLYDASGKALRDFGSVWVNTYYEDILSVEDYNTNKSCVYDLNGKLLFDNMQVSYASGNFIMGYNENYTPVLADKSGRIIIDDSQYEEIRIGNSDKYAIVFDSDYVPLVANNSGRIITNLFDKRDPEILSDNYIRYYNDNYEPGIVNIDGEVVIPAGEYDKIEHCLINGVDYFAVQKDGKVQIGTPERYVIVYAVDKWVEFDQRPVIENGRTLVPVRAIFEALGATVEWDEATKTVTAKQGLHEIKITIDSDTMYVRGEPRTLDVPAKIINGRTLVPVRAISVAFGYQVIWDGYNKIVSINK